MIYPTYDQCSDKDDLRLQFDYYSGSVNWSDVLDAFYFYTFNSTTLFGEELVLSNFPAFSLLFALIYWILVYALSILLSLILTPILGGICFITCACICYCLGKCFKIFGRRVLITFEKIRRARERILIPKKYRHFRRKFRMPEILRNYSDEEVPKELERDVSTDDSMSNDDDDEDLFLAELERQARQRKFSASWSTFGRSKIGLAEEPVQKSDGQQFPDKATAATETVQNVEEARVKKNSMTETAPLQVHQATETTGRGSPRLSDASSTEEDDHHKPETIDLSIGTQTTMESSIASEEHNNFFGKQKRQAHGGPKTAALGRNKGKKPHNLAPGVTETISHVAFMEKRAANRQIEADHGKTDGKPTGHQNRNKVQAGVARRAKVNASVPAAGHVIQKSNTSPASLATARPGLVKQIQPNEANRHSDAKHEDPKGEALKIAPQTAESAGKHDHKPHHINPNIQSRQADEPHKPVDKKPPGPVNKKGGKKSSKDT